MEKGALGLFFELNYLIGLFLTAYITWFVNIFKPPEPLLKTASASQKEDFKNMYMWLYINYIYLFICVFVALIVACIYKSMNAKAKQLAKV